jgi:rubrerythrin
MSDLIKLDVVDQDGAIREAEEAVAGDSRADFFRKAALGGAATLGGGVLLSGFPGIALGATPSKKNDVKILNYALTLEYLENEFYIQGLKSAGITGELLTVSKVVQSHEAAHVKTLKKVLGKSAVKKPKFDFGKAVTDPATFLATAVVLEDTGVSAYAGQGPLIKQKAVAVAALSIHSVEARHAALLRRLANKNGAPKSFDKAASMKTVLSAVKKTGFIKG